MFEDMPYMDTPQMRLSLCLMPFQAFTYDAAELKAEEDESRLPIRWLAAAQVATRLSDSRPKERKQLIKLWVEQVADVHARNDGVWSALSVPGIEVRDLGTGCKSLVAMAAEMLKGGARYLAYCTAVHVRIALMENGPVEYRVGATLLQADVLRALNLMDQTKDTYEAALEDAVRAGDLAAETAVKARLVSLLAKGG